MQLRVDSLASTHAVAAALAAIARPGDVIALAGEMGAGKTAFAQGFGASLGIREVITSPTFTLVHSYPIPGTKRVLHHADLYRLETTNDIDDLALHELAAFDGIVLVEWGDVGAAALGDHLEVRLELDEDDESEDDESEGGGESGGEGGGDEFVLDERRLITIEATGPGWAGRWDRLTTALEEYRC